MLEYEWDAQSNVMLSGDNHTEESSDQHDNNHRHNQFYDQHYFTDPSQLVNPIGFAHPNLNLAHPMSFQTPDPHFGSLYDPRASYAPYPLDADQYMVVPKAEPVPDFASRIGLNLGGRTYFSSAESEFVSRLYRRSRPAEAGLVNAPRCQAEGCSADLTHAKHYHRRHKVCEFHSKAAAVVAAGLTQRFCQQCSRFHLLTEFDNGKRSCRKRLADHNRRRRKSNQANTNQEQHQTPKSHNENALTDSASDNVTRSPQDSGTQSTSSVTVAISPPRISLDYFQHRSY